MLWVILSLSAGFFVALSDALNKRYLGQEGYMKMALARTLGTLPFLLPVLLYLIAKKDVYLYLTWDFIQNVLVLLSLEIMATLFYMRGIEISPLSASLPFLSFTPIFVIFTGYFILGERISLPGFLGILLIVVGAYMIHLPRRVEGFLGPVKGIWRERGSFYILVTALIYGITSVLGKRGIMLSDPLFFASIYFSLLSVVTPFVLLMIKPSMTVGVFLKQNSRGILLIGLTQALMCLSHMLALSLVETAYMIALKRSSILFAVLLGWYMFREKHFRLRLSASLVMFLGIIVIAFFK